MAGFHVCSGLIGGNNPLSRIVAFLRCYLTWSGLDDNYFTFWKVFPEDSAHSKLSFLLCGIQRNFEHSSLVQVVADPNLQFVQKSLRALDRAHGPSLPKRAPGGFL